MGHAGAATGQIAGEAQLVLEGEEAAARTPLQRQHGDAAGQVGAGRGQDPHLEPGNVTESDEQIA